MRDLLRTVLGVAILIAIGFAISLMPPMVWRIIAGVVCLAVLIALGWLLGSALMSLIQRGARRDD